MRKNYILGFLVFMFGVMFLTPSVHAKEVSFIVGDKELNSTVTEITDGNDGKAIWNSDTNTLTIENFDYEGNGIFVDDFIGDVDDFITAFGILDDNDVKVIVKGNNTFKLNSSLPNYHIIGCFGGNVTFEGTGEIKFISSDADNVPGSIGLLGYNDIVLNDATIAVDMYKGMHELYGIYAFNDITVNDGNVIARMHDAESGDAFISESNISINNSLVDIVFDEGTYLKGIRSSSFNSNNSIVNVDTGIASEEAYGIYTDNDIVLENSNVKIKSDKSGIFADTSLTLNTTDIEVIAPAGENLVLNSSASFTYNGYSDTVIWINTLPGIVGCQVWDKTTNLHNYKFLKIVTNKKNGAILFNNDNSSLNVSKDELLGSILLSDVDRFRISQNQDLVINMRVTDDITDIDRNLVNSNLNGYKLGMIKGIDLYKKIGDDEEKHITNLANNVRISYKLDDSLVKKNRIYKVIKIHDGEVSLLDGVINYETNEILFETNGFSTYAFIYKDELDENPKTMDNIHAYMFYLSISIVGLSGSLVLRKKLVNN